MQIHRELLNSTKREINLLFGMGTLHFHQQLYLHKKLGGLAVVVTAFSSTVIFT